MRTALFWVDTQRVIIISYRRFYRTLEGRDFIVQPVDREGRLYDNNVKVDLRKLLCEDLLSGTSLWGIQHVIRDTNVFKMYTSVYNICSVV